MSEDSYTDCFKQAAGAGHERAKKLLAAQNIGW